MKSPVYRAVNKPMLIFGVDRRVFAGLFVSALVMFSLTNYLMAPAVFLLVSFVAARRLMKDDHKMAEIAFHSMRQGKLYEAAGRKA